MPVNSKDPCYDKFFKRWKLVRKVIDNDAIEYIRDVDPKDDKRNQQYKEDAILTNFTRLTKEGLTGLVFKKPATYEIPEKISYLEKDATGQDMPLEQFAQEVFGEVLQTGRYGILVDYPPSEAAQTLLDDQLQNNVARFRGYASESIINYKTKQVNSKWLLSLVTLVEWVEDPDNEDMFDHVMVCRYRALYLDFAGRYTQTVYDDAGKVVEGPFLPTKYNGEYWNIIPFTFIGSENNDPKYDPIPLYDLAIINIGHYRNSADYEESIFLCGQPFPVISIGGNVEEFKAANPEGVKWGSRAGLNVGEGGDAKLLQANPNQLADAAMKRKEEQAASIGARLIAPPGAGRETAEGVRIRFGAQNSALYIITKNISLAFTNAFMWAAEYMGAPVETIEFSLNNDFYDDPIDSQTLMMLIQGFDRGLVTDKEVREYIKDKGGNTFLTADDSEINAVQHTTDPLAGVNVS